MTIINDFFDYWCEEMNDEEMEMHKQILRIDLEMQSLMIKRKMLMDNVIELNAQKMNLQRRYFS